MIICGFDQCARYRGKEKHEREFYHGMLLGLLKSRGNWKIQSNAETGEGYSDISIQMPERIGIVIELKYAHDGNLKRLVKQH